ncbi:lysozyme [Croceibacterium aestuarii]|uniref:lysozyme n=1 Tax=Croceibacterium aestuarii TaxID=3064139 RepID=UPI00272EE5D8|nr:lysozyme [Croceibacterium sp. D39]
MRERRARRGEFGRRLRKRKAVLALSAGALGLSTGASDPAMLDWNKTTVQANVDQRLPAGMRSVSEGMKAVMMEEEGVRYHVYRDVAGNPTVGVGHLVTAEDGLSVGQRVGQDRILDFFEEDLKQAESAVARITGDLPLYQNEFDALVDLAFNVGEGNLSPANSPHLRAAIAAHDYDAIASQLDYVHADGRVAGGLVNRSERRTRIFELASYADPRELPASERA